MDGFLGLRRVGLLLASTVVALAIGCGSSSPDQLVFVSTIDGDEEIYLLDVDSGETTPLTANNTRDFDPVFSPDGKFVAYLADQAGDWKLIWWTALGKPSPA